MNILIAFSKTIIADKQTTTTIGKLIVKEFSNPNTKEQRLEELLILAYQFDIPQLEEMMSQFNFETKVNNLIWKA